MRLEKGKFYDSAGNVVPLEFGNKEQIKLIAHADNMLRLLESGDYEPDIKTRVTQRVEFMCPCGGGEITFEGDGDDEAEASWDLNGQNDTCRQCERTYELKDTRTGWVVIMQK